MTIEEFVVAEHESVEKFKQTWLEGQENDPGKYPVELDGGEWDDQIRAFQELQNDAGCK